MLTVTAIIVLAIITILWSITYLIPRNYPQNAEYHHGLDTDYKNLKGNSLAIAKVNNTVVSHNYDTLINC